MQNKLLAILLVTGLVVSFAIVMPSASALTARTDFSNRHSSASRGNSVVCGDHRCMPGEKTEWANKLSELQRTGVGKINSNSTYVDILKNIHEKSHPNTDHMPMKMDGSHMSMNMTHSSNSTKNTK